MEADDFEGKKLIILFTCITLPLTFEEVRQINSLDQVKTGTVIGWITTAYLDLHTLKLLVAGLSLGLHDAHLLIHGNPLFSQHGVSTVAFLLLGLQLLHETSQ